MGSKSFSLFSRVPRDSTPRFVRPSVTLYFFYDFIFLTTLLLPKWSGDLEYGPCPPLREFGGPVSGLVSKDNDNQELKCFGRRGGGRLQPPKESICTCFHGMKEKVGNLGVKPKNAKERRFFPLSLVLFFF